MVSISNGDRTNLNIVGLEVNEKVVSDHEAKRNSDSEPTKPQYSTEKPHFQIEILTYTNFAALDI